MKNKKLFAILTLVAFMLTMMPVMAFATTSDMVGAWVEDGSAKVYVSGDVKDANKVIVSVDVPTLVSGEEAVYVFTTVAGTNEVYVPSTVTVKKGNKDVTATAWVAEQEAVVIGGGNGIFDITYTNNKAVELDVKAVLVKKLGSDPVNELKAAAVVNKVSSGVDYTYANIAWDADNTVEFADNRSYDNVITYKVTNTEEGNVPGLHANNGVDYVEYTVTVKNEADAAVKGAEVEVTVNKAGASVNSDVITTNTRGIAKFIVSASKAGTYAITLSTDKAEDVEITGITFNSAALGSVKAADVTGHYATDATFSVVLTGMDANGNTLTGAQLYGMLDANRDFVWTKVPADSVFDTEEPTELGDPGLDYRVNPDTGACELRITPDVAGDYTLKMYNGVTGSGVEYINFSAKDFVKTTQLVVTYDAATYNLGAEIGAPILTCIDANGTKKFVATSPKFSFTGVGVADGTFNASTGAMTLGTDDKYLGKEIVVSVVAEKCFASTTLKIADAAAYLQFTEVTGAVGTEVTVPVKSLDLAGNVAALGVEDMANLNADFVVTSKPAGAVVSVDVAGIENANFAKKGASAIKVASTKEGTVTVNVILSVGTAPNEKYLTGIATVNFGDVATPVQTSATLIIGSNVFVANGGVQTAPAAPVIIDGRTYLPIRAVGQSIGAQVDYVDGVITLTLGAQKATMVPGSNVMTVGTETVTMDAAPYLAGDGHTMVPVRYAAQAFGYELGTTTNADGSVATVTIFK